MRANNKEPSDAMEAIKQRVIWSHGPWRPRRAVARLPASNLGYASAGGLARWGSAPGRPAHGG